MLDIRFRLSLFDEPERRSTDERILRLLLVALTEADVAYLRRHPETPRLYASGVRYQREPKGVELWSDVPTIISLGYGDCDDLAPWRLAELRVFGEDRGASLRIDAFPKSDGGRTYHIRVNRTRGAIPVEDPSARLGMPVPPNWTM